MAVITTGDITCPQCGHAQVADMPTDACQFFYECGNCNAILKPQQGDCRGGLVCLNSAARFDKWNHAAVR